MREIKFRAWHKLRKEMYNVYGWHSEFVFKDTLDGIGSDGNPDLLKDVILMQYTGLKDKNGVEIYDGDLLRVPPKSEWEKTNFAFYEVFFHDGDANMDYNICFSIARSHYQGAVCGGYIPSFKPKQVLKMEAIGNIYENPELL